MTNQFPIHVTILLCHAQKVHSKNDCSYTYIMIALYIQLLQYVIKVIISTRNNEILRETPSH